MRLVRMKGNQGIKTRFKKGDKPLWKEESRKKLSNSLKGHTVSKETKHKISKTLKERNSRNRIYNLEDYKKYRQQVDLLTKMHKDKLYNNRDGYCFYSHQYIKYNLGKIINYLQQSTIK